MSICPIFKRFDVRLFSSFSLSTVVLYFFAIEYRESPDLTVYVVSLELSSGIFRTWPICNRFDVRLFAFFMASTVVL